MSESEEKIVNFLVIVGIVLFMLFIVYLIIDGEHVKQTADCSYFAERFMKDVPARCIAYFSNPR